MKNAHRLYIGLAALAMSAGVLAQARIVNDAKVSGESRAFATVTGPVGQAHSFATGRQQATADGQLQIVDGQPGTVAFSGIVTTLSEGTAFNVSTGAASGSASTDGFAKGAVSLAAEYYAPHQWIVGGGLADAGYDTAGARTSIRATTNQGSTATADGVYHFTGNGTVGGNYTQEGINIESAVQGALNVTHVARSTAVTGKVVVDGAELADADTVQSVSEGIARAWLELRDPR